MVCPKCKKRIEIEKPKYFAGIFKIKCPRCGVKLSSRKGNSKEYVRKGGSLRRVMPKVQISKKERRRKFKEALNNEKIIIPE